MVINLNNKDHKLFPLTEIFDYRRGRRLIELNQIDGNIAYISSTKLNNGISNYISPPDYMEIYNNSMTLSNSGSVGYLFYHEYEFVASDHCTVIWLKDKKIKLNKFIYLYLKPIFEAMKPRYNFGREIKNSRFEKEKILLPIIKETKEVDWEFMENYIKELIPKITFNKIKTQNKLDIKFDMASWKEFEINKVFPLLESGKISNASILDEGIEIPYIGAKKKDAGVIKLVNYNDEIINEGPCFAFICDGDGSVGYTNYISYEQFACTVNVHLGKNIKLNKFNALFLVAVFDLQRQKYSFGRKWGKRLNKTKVYLPANKDGEIDWKYMEEFIKNNRYGDLV